MSHCSRKRSFPHWEKKHRKRAEELRRRVMKMYAVTIAGVVNTPDALWDAVRRVAVPGGGEPIRFMVDPYRGRQWFAGDSDGR